MAPLAISTKTTNTSREKESRYVLRLRIASMEFKKSFSSWDELSRNKELIKPFAKWDSITKSWLVKDYVDNVEKASKIISRVFGVSEDLVSEVLREHNDVVLISLTREVAGTKTIVMYGYLDDRQYSTLKKYCEKRGNRRMEFSEYKFLKDFDIMSTTKEKIEEKINAWMNELKKMPVLFDEEAIKSAVNDIWDAIRSMKRVVAEYVVEQENGRERGWIKLIFNRGLGRSNIWNIKEELMKIREIPYNIEVFEEGQRKLKEITIYGIKFKKEEPNAVFVAPFMYQEVRKFLKERGFEIEETELELPATAPITTIQDITEKLRPYQREALENWINNNYRGTIVIPTGGGKTWIGLAAVSILKVPTVVFVPTINLALQWKDFFKDVLGLSDKDVGILGGGYHEIGKPVLVCIYDSGVKYAREIAKRYTLYIYDEGHHVAAESFKEIAWHSMAPYRMALSATVERNDRNEALIFKMCGDKVYETTFYELVKQGYLAPIRVEFLEVGFPPDEEMKYIELAKQLDKVKREFGRLYEKYEEEAWENGYSNVGEYLRKTKNPEYKELNRKAMSIRQRMRILEQKNSNKVLKAIELASKHIDEENKTFVFTNLENQAKKIYEELRKRYGAKVGLVIGKTSSAERDRIFRLFKEGKIRCIVTTTVLDEGIDAPDSDVAIVVSSRAIKHPRQFVQRIGRIVRPKPNKLSYVYIMRTKGGIEESSLDELYTELDRVYQFSKLEELIEAREKSIGIIKFEAKATLEKAKRVGGHKARILFYSSLLRDLIGRRAHVKVYDSNGKLVKEADLKIGKKIYKGYEYGKLSISLPVDYGGKKMMVEVYPY